MAAAAAGIDWAAWGTAALGAAQQATTAGLAYLAGLPRNCFLATAHASMVCTNRDPQYETLPGFGPIALGWGWLLLGMMFGVLLTLSALTITGKIKQEPSIMQLAALMRTEVQAATAPLPHAPATTSQGRADALRYIAMAPETGLRELATAARMSDGAFLAMITGSATPRAPGLTIHQ